LAAYFISNQAAVRRIVPRSVTLIGTAPTGSAGEWRGIPSA
jgi:hypothetical protein